MLTLRWGRRNPEGGVLASLVSARRRCACAARSPCSSRRLGLAPGRAAALRHQRRRRLPQRPAARRERRSTTPSSSSPSAANGTAAAALRRPAAALRKPASTARPTLTDDQIPAYFKDATFGVPAGEVASTIEPRPGRDDRPRHSLRRPAHLRRHPRRHDVRRRLRRRRRPPLPDGRPAPHRPRRTRLLPRRLPTPMPTPRSGAFAPYTEADLQKQLDQAPQALRRSRGSRPSTTCRAYVDGINAYVAAASADPALKPAEYALLEQADGSVEADRRRRDRLADRWHLRPAAAATS